MKLLFPIISVILLTLLVFAALVVSGWITLALWYRIPGLDIIRGAASGLWLIFVLAIISLARKLPLASVGLFLLSLVFIGIWWQSITPSLDRDWAVDVSKTVTGTVDNNIVTLQNVRNFNWTSDSAADAKWETRQYDLNKLNEADMVLSYWGMDAIAHTLVSFGFEDGQRVVFSVETRREKTESYSSIAGFFKTYELAFLAADERDILYLRTNMRKEDTYLYPLDIPKQAMRALFLNYVNSADQLARQPKFYDTITTNCTTVVFDLARQIEPGIPTDYRVLLSGYLPGYLAEHGASVWKLPEPELRKRAAISAKAQAAGNSPADYSSVIRQ
ncbi:DUF4105 domain-containing protein [Rhizobium oryziradicis]|uniref:Lnb N-terminal periplasmic domain-containing protein n=1 Tax=Rhizobium oryziradicis TaxID=1867956 RepID=A0A1Q8ZNK1_9HYPH|nr:DUF4105 domain-containing protein [Rhizobium oryziradicis]OLP43470.1 hypothetical protein BJF95_21595 [Rhizobium oryziradicis]